MQSQSTDTKIQGAAELFSAGDVSGPTESKVLLTQLEGALTEK